MREAPRRIVLVGFMGAGKTTVGRELARQLGWRFEDLDARLEARLGTPIATLFRQRGEAAFREEERREAESLALVTQCVIAAGGGAFAEPATRDALCRGALSVWLRCDLDTLLGRIPLDGSRPKATDRATMRQLLDQREPSYRLADLTVDTAGLPSEEVAHRIRGALVESPGGRMDR